MCVSFSDSWNGPVAIISESYFTGGGSLIAAESHSELHQETISDFIFCFEKNLILDVRQQWNIWAKRLEDCGLSICLGGKEDMA